MSPSQRVVRQRAASRIQVSVDEYEKRRAARQKWCYRARHWAAIETFSVDRSRFDGLNASCTPCRRAARVTPPRPATPPASPSGFALLALTRPEARSA